MPRAAMLPALSPFTRGLWSRVPSGVRRKQFTALLLAASGAVYLFVLARCGYRSIVHKDDGSGDLWTRRVVPTWLAVVVLAVATVWAALFTGMVLFSGFSWGHLHHARDNVVLLFRYPGDCRRWASVLEWIHVADLTSQNQRDYQDLYTISQPLAPVPFVPNMMDMDNKDLWHPNRAKCPCPEDADPDVNLWKLSDACQAVEDYVAKFPYLYRLVCKERDLHASKRTSSESGPARLSTRDALCKLWEKKNLGDMFPDLWPLLDCDTALLSDAPGALDYSANKEDRGGLHVCHEELIPGSGSLLKNPLTPSPARSGRSLLAAGRLRAQVSRTGATGLRLPRLRVGTRVRVGTTFPSWRTCTWLPTGLTGTVECYGMHPDTEGMFKVVWDDPDLDLLQSQWVHPMNWRYIWQLGVVEEARPRWALRRKCLTPPGPRMAPGDLISHAHNSWKWFQRRLHCRNSALAARGVQYEIVRELEGAERLWIRFWGSITWFWLPLCVATSISIHGHVWLSHWMAAATVLKGVESPAEIAELGVKPIADIVLNATEMCDAFDIVAAPLTIRTFKLVVFQIAVTVVLGQGRSGQKEKDWWVSVRQAWQQHEGDGCSSRWGRVLPVLGPILFAVFNIAGFALALVHSFVLLVSGERRLSWWDDYETFLVITVVNPAVASLVQLLLRLRDTAPPRSLQRSLYYFGLGLLGCYGIPAFLTHIGLAILVVIGSLVLLPLAMPLAAVVSYLFPGAEPVFATIASDTLGMLSVVGVLTLSAAAAALMFAVVYPLVMFCAALLTAVRNWPGINSVNCGFWDSTERRWQKFYDACHAVSQGPSCRRRHKPAFPRKIRVRVFEKLPQDQGPEVKKQFEWFKQKGLNGKVAEFTGAFAGYFAVWTFENGAKYWMDTDFVRVVERAPAFRGRLKMVIASVTGSLPAAVASVVKANIVRFVLQSFTLYMVLWYAGNPLSKVAEEEFHARSVNLYARCFLGDMFRTWDNMQHMFSWL
eukprot:TRINITY_DN13037_c0_g1_i2.p1 TRINITY_DN13037_c0_g1~~TRINITY_DN13037_c0_g1_i2.p1  ORF type:complete len:993 (+),score=124.50 TRINITY_DN13037_c0_g1_i2:57-3035(+)